MKTHLNLLPWTIRRRTIIRRRLLAWAAVCVFSGVGMLVALLLVQADIRRSTTLLAEIDLQAEPVRRLVEDRRKLGHRIDVADRRRALVDVLGDSQHPLQILWVVSKSAHIKNGAIQIRSFEFDSYSVGIRKGVSKQRGRAAREQDSDVSTARKLNLSGIAIDDAALSRFVTGLREAGMFEAVELRSAGNIALASGPAREYSLECRF